MPTFKKLDSPCPAWFHTHVANQRDIFLNTRLSDDDKNLAHDWAYDMVQEYEAHIVTYEYDYFNHDFNWKEVLHLLDENKIVIFSCEAEGWGIQDNECLQNLHHAIRDFKLDKDKIFFISGNLVENDSYKRWCKSINSEQHVNIIELCSWDYMVSNFRYIDEQNNHIEKFLNERLNILEERVTHFFVNLSRRTRIPRTYLSYKFHQMPEEWRMLSHDKVSTDDNGYKLELQHSSLSDHEKVFTYMTEHTPFIADTTDFETNYAIQLNKDLHLESYFSVVSETFQKNWDGSSMFFSEKTFKPILLGMPFLIYGQQGCNQFLRKMGYRLYNDLFDYSFDQISDEYERADAVYNEVERVCLMLDKMSIKERLDWAFECEKILRHNVKNLLRLHDMKKITQLDFLDKVYRRYGFKNI